MEGAVRNIVAVTTDTPTTQDYRSALLAFLAEPRTYAEIVAWDATSGVGSGVALQVLRVLRDDLGIVETLPRKHFGEPLQYRAREGARVAPAGGSLSPALVSAPKRRALTLLPPLPPSSDELEPEPSTSVAETIPAPPDTQGTHDDREPFSPIAHAAAVGSLEDTGTPVVHERVFRVSRAEAESLRKKLGFDSE